jgi:hypothetical protein
MLRGASQKIDNLPNGGCMLAVKAGSTLEMKPFMRQWGVDRIVLVPNDLRCEHSRGNAADSSALCGPAISRIKQVCE